MGPYVSRFRVQEPLSRTAGIPGTDNEWLPRALSGRNRTIAVAPWRAERALNTPGTWHMGGQPTKQLETLATEKQRA